MKNAPLIENYYFEESLLKWNKIKKILNLMCIEYEINKYLMRGLDYYNDLVFEFKSSYLGSQDTFCAGGRYNGLSKIFNENKEIPSVGASIGIDRLLLCLNQNYDKKLEEKKLAIITSKEEYNLYALNLSMELSKNNFINQIYFDKKSFKSAFKKADNDKVFAVLIIGDNEFETKNVSIKILETSDQKTISFFDCINYLNKKRNESF